MQPGARSLMVAAVAALTACADAHTFDPAQCVKPVVSQTQITSNPNNVLSAFVTADVSHSDSVRAEYGGAYQSRDAHTPAAAATPGTTTLLLLGLYPGSDYSAAVVAYNACGKTEGLPATFTTDELPADIPRYDAAGLGAARGYVVFAAGSYGLVIDNSGRVVWYHRFTVGPGLNFQAQPNGRYTARPPGPGGTWVEIDPAGAVTRSLGCAGGMSARMHDMIAQRDGSYWLLCDELRTVDLSAQGRSSTAGVLGTAAQHMSAQGDVLFSWSPFDHLDVDLSALDAADLGGATINWTHGNSIDLDHEGNLLLSFRNLSEITKIDTRTGAVIWRMGGARNQFTFPDVPAQPFKRQHGVRASGNGGVLLLDNLGESPGSRAEYYAVDTGARSARLTGSYMSSARLVAEIGGSTQQLSGGHTLVSFGNGGGVEQYDAAGNVAWRLTGNPGYVFRAQRIVSLYDPGRGTQR